MIGSQSKALEKDAFSIIRPSEKDRYPATIQEWWKWFTPKL